jgi:hypothetical protein
MTLRFGAGVETYLRRHGGALTIRASPRHGCCGGTVAVPVAETGAPRDPTTYDVAECEGVRVYVAQDLLPHVAGPVRIEVEGLGPWRRLWVTGIDARM